MNAKKRIVYIVLGIVMVIMAVSVGVANAGGPATPDPIVATAPVEYSEYELANVYDFNKKPTVEVMGGWWAGEYMNSYSSRYTVLAGARSEIIKIAPKVDGQPYIVELPKGSIVWVPVDEGYKYPRAEFVLAPGGGVAAAVVFYNRGEVDTRPAPKPVAPRVR